jgi:outer membrane receptor protein involved in Fe transport
LIYSLFQYESLISTNNTTGGYAFGGSMGDAQTGAFSARLTNKDLKWETQKQLNIGIDLRGLNNRLSAEIDWYNRTVSDFLVVEPVLMSFGANPAPVNGGDVRNTGIELGLHWNDHVGKDFTYGVNLALGQNKNKVVKLGKGDNTILGPISVLWETSEEVYRTAEIGKPFGYFIGYATDGVFQNQAQIDNYAGPLLRGANTRPGDVIWRDSNNDGTIDEKDRTMIGNPHPDVTMGLSFNVGYKGVDLSVTTYGAFGHQILRSYRDYISSPYNNYTTEVFTYWHGEGSSNHYPRLGSADWTRISDLLIEDGDYLKIKDITLGYDFKHLFKQIPLAQLKIFVSAQNLYTFTNYKGMDPEVGYGNGSSVAGGIDLGFYPSARTYMVGASIKF